jgi:putative heme iron utilization protein
MADKTANPALYRKRLELQRHEQLLTLRRQELRIMELEDEKEKTTASAENTKRIIGDVEKEMVEAGIDFKKEEI